MSQLEIRWFGQIGEKMSQKVILTKKTSEKYSKEIQKTGTGTMTASTRNKLPSPLKKDNRRSNSTKIFHQVKSSLKWMILSNTHTRTYSERIAWLTFVSTLSSRYSSHKNRAGHRSIRSTLCIPLILQDYALIINWTYG